MFLFQTYRKVQHRHHQEKLLRLVYTKEYMKNVLKVFFILLEIFIIAALVILLVDMMAIVHVDVVGVKQSKKLK